MYALLTPFYKLSLYIDIFSAGFFFLLAFKQSIKSSYVLFYLFNWIFSFICNFLFLNKGFILQILCLNWVYLICTIFNLTVLYHYYFIIINSQMSFKFRRTNAQCVSALVTRGQDCFNTTSWIELSLSQSHRERELRQLRWLQWTVFLQQSGSWSRSIISRKFALILSAP